MGTVIVREYDPAGWLFVIMVMGVLLSPFVWAGWPLLMVVWGHVFEYMSEAGDRRLRKAQAEEAKARAEETRARADLIRSLTAQAQGGNVGPLLAELYRLQSLGAVDPAQAQAVREQLAPPPSFPWTVEAPSYRPATAARPRRSTVLDNALALVDQGVAELTRRGW